MLCFVSDPWGSWGPLQNMHTHMQNVQVPWVEFAIQVPTSKPSKLKIGWKVNSMFYHAANLLKAGIKLLVSLYFFSSLLSLNLPTTLEKACLLPLYCNTIWLKIKTEISTEFLTTVINYSCTYRGKLQKKKQMEFILPQTEDNENKSIQRLRRIFPD